MIGNENGMTLRERLETLHQKATTYAHEHSTGVYCGDDCFAGHKQAEVDAELIVLLRNALPQLLKMMEMAEKMADALAGMQDCDSLTRCNICHTQAMKALAEFEAEKGTVK